MADFPTSKTDAVDNVTEVLAKHLNNLEDKVGIDGDTNENSLDYLIKKKIGEIVDAEVPSGTIDGSNKTFTIAHTPISGSLKLFLNGMLLKENDDYTLSGTTITMNYAPESGSNFIASYRYTY